MSEIKKIFPVLRQIWHKFDVVKYENDRSLKGILMFEKRKNHFDQNVKTSKENKESWNRKQPSKTFLLLNIQKFDNIDEIYVKKRGLCFIVECRYIDNVKYLSTFILR